MKFNKESRYGISIIQGGGHSSSYDCGDGISYDLDNRVNSLLNAIKEDDNFIGIADIIPLANSSGIVKSVVVIYEKAQNNE